MSGNKTRVYHLEPVECWKWVCDLCEVESLGEAGYTKRDVMIGLKIHLQLKHKKTEAQAEAILEGMRV